MSNYDNPKHQIFVGYLPDDATMDDVEDLFKPYGNVKSINLKPGYGKRLSASLLRNKY